jgi:hypothetical protein
MPVKIVQPGDVLIVRTGGWAGILIRIGAWLRRKPDVWNHAVIAHHIDAAGTWWGIEGRPGGVGWKDIRGFLSSPVTLTTAELWAAATPEQRRTICEGAEALLTTRYDNVAIIVAALQVIDPLWQTRARSEWGGEVPAQVICTSLVDYLGEQVGLPTPERDRWCTPWDWAELIMKEDSRG